MVDNTGLISKYINNELSEKERFDFKEKLKSDRKFFEEFVFQKKLEDLLKFMYAKKMFENPVDEKLQAKIDLMYENWTKDKNSEEQLRTKKLIDKLIDDHEKAQIEKEAEILEIESGFEDIDKEIDEMIKFSNQENIDSDTKLLITDILDEIDNEKTSVNPELKTIEITKKRKSNYYFYAIAAIGLILLTITTILVFKAKPDGRKLFAEYYKNTVISDINRDTTQVSILQNEAANYFLNQDYENASEIYNELIILQPEENSNYFSLAVCNIEQKNFEQTEKILIEYREKFPNTFVKATWYLGLCYLYLENYEKAIAEFEKIKNTDTYKELPEEIIRKIK
jgi:tetratricopeptide (TPR) repeat protein